jgi:non-ribosomal peptide synthase protein (TIGR01720 family)
VAARPLDPARDTRANAGQVTVTLPAEVTEAVLTTVPAVFHAEINDVLLAAFALAVAAWRGGDRSAVLVDLEGHGREEHLVAGADLARTVGWFTTVYPVRLDVGSLDGADAWADAWAGGPAAGQVLKRIKEQLRAVPDKGIGYGLLRYANPRTAPVLAGPARPQIGFNYLGRFSADASTDWSALPDVDTGGDADPGMPLAHVLELNAFTHDGPDGPRLVATWTWAGDLVSEERVRDLGLTWFRALEALAGHARRPDAGGLTPSDVALTAISQAEINEFEDDLNAEWGMTQ